MDKFGRNYILKVETRSRNIITITLPMTIEFDITRNTLTSANVCQIRIYNLGEKNRNEIRFNQSDYGTFRSVELLAGYGDNLAKIFSGNISQAWSHREGVNFITQIECFDGGFAFNNSHTEAQFPVGVSQRDVIIGVARNLLNVKLGSFGNFPDRLSRRIALNGSTTQILDDLTGGGFFIDNGKVNAMHTNEYISDQGAKVLVISPKSGLLGTPILEQTIVRFDMLFEPALNVGYKVRLESITGVNFNGEYKITSVKHRGMISDAVCGSVITTGEFFYTKILLPAA